MKELDEELQEELEVQQELKIPHTFDRQEVYEETIQELSKLIPVRSGILFVDGTGKSIGGRYWYDINMLELSVFLEDVWDFKNVLAHQLIHSCGVKQHGPQFLEMCQLINNSGMGYNVRVGCSLKELKEAREQKERNEKRYLVYCDYCSWGRIFKVKKKSMKGSMCPRCRHKLRQKIYTDEDRLKIRYTGD